MRRMGFRILQILKNMSKRSLRVALLCGGPSLERGISLNSARSVMDHLQSAQVEILPIYFDHHKNAYSISCSQLYSNTPSDFDFKLAQTSKPLSATGLSKLLKEADLAFPAMHGAFGEDGEIQALLEKNNVPYVGSPKEACKICFDKYRANEFIKEHGFHTLPSTVLKIHEPEQHQKILQSFFKKHQSQRAVVKPATGGSSIGVYSVNNVEEAQEAAHNIFKKRIDTRVVVEPFAKGIEFTVIILQNRFGLPVALFPTEIEADYTENQIFDFRKKYLATRQVTYHCPPRFSQEVTETIQIQAEQLFTLLGMRDFARFDGWLLEDGNIWFSDFNPISGMEQNSFLFLQAAQVGFSHGDLLNFIIHNAAERLNIDFPERPTEKSDRQEISVIFGGKTAERQVSVMSGTNAWLKLRKSQKYKPQPYLLDLDNKSVWKLPYSKTLNHTVEEISENCHQAEAAEARLAPIRRLLLQRLAAKPGHLNEELFIPQKISLKKFIEQSNFVFIGLHGGIGENGTLQKMLEDAGKPFNGSGSTASAICMDKYKTGEVLQGLEKEGIHVPAKSLLNTAELLAQTPDQLKQTWKTLRQDLQSPQLIVKPKDDGCSAGIMRLNSATDFATYLDIVRRELPHIPPNTFKDQSGLIEMPQPQPKELLFEQFIKTDRISVIQNELKWQRVSGWIEITMGLLGKKGQMRALHPSLTVASGTVLSLEEKFQGGTGVNITPPPAPHVRPRATRLAMDRMEIVAKKLGLSGYARIDAFMDTQTGEIMIIEANTTPALTPSTVIFHQALAEKSPLAPTAFLEKLIEYHS